MTCIDLDPYERVDRDPPWYEFKFTCSKSKDVARQGIPVRELNPFALERRRKKMIDHGYRVTEIKEIFT